MTTSTTARRGRPPALATATALVRAAHAGPAAVVTTVTGVLAAAAGLPPRTAVTVTGAVFTGQLTVGWVNDLADAQRDAAVGRTDKPLATGALEGAVVRRALVPAALGCVLLSAAAGRRSAVVHLGLGMASAHAYNLVLKGTPLSGVPFALAFGSLPAVVSLAGPHGGWPPASVTVAGGCLGVGAHLLNALPDLADDAATDIRGMPHRLGPRRARALAAVLLGTASVATVLTPGKPLDSGSGAALVSAAGLVGATLFGRGRTPFVAAMLLALLDVALLARATR